MEEQEQKTKVDYSFLGIPLTREKRALHGCLLWFVCVLSTALYSVINQPIDQFQMNYWIFFPILIISYNLIEKILPWYENFKLEHFWKSKSFYLNLLVYFAMTFFGMLTVIFIFVIFK